MKLRETARNWLVQEKIGLLTKEELINLADTYIKKNEDYPYWIQKISMNESIEREPRLDLIMEPIIEKDCSLVVKIMLNLYNESKLDMYNLAAIAHNNVSFIGLGKRCI